MTAYPGFLRNPVNITLHRQNGHYYSLSLQLRFYQVCSPAVNNVISHNNSHVPTNLSLDKQITGERSRDTNFLVDHYSTYLAIYRINFKLQISLRQFHIFDINIAFWKRAPETSPGCVVIIPTQKFILYSRRVSGQIF